MPSPMIARKGGLHGYEYWVDKGASAEGGTEGGDPYYSRAWQERKFVTSTSRDGHAGQAQRAAEQGERRRYLPEYYPSHEDCERWDEVGGRSHLTCRGPGEGVRPSREGERRWEHPR